MKLKKGDKVVMHTCGEAEYYSGKIWICKTSQFQASNGSEVVFLEGFSGYFLTEYLQIVNLESNKKEVKPTSDMDGDDIRILFAYVVIGLVFVVMFFAVIFDV